MFTFFRVFVCDDNNESILKCTAQNFSPITYLIFNRIKEYEVIDFRRDQIYQIYHKLRIALSVWITIFNNHILLQK